MNRGKTYQNWQERKADRETGGKLVIVVNVLLLIILNLPTQWINSAEIPNLKMGLLWLPWVINIGLIILALIFRPEVATGYLMTLAVILGSIIAMGVGLVAGCFAWIVIILGVGGPLSFIIGNGAEIIGVMLGFIVFIAVFLWVTIKFAIAIGVTVRPFGPPDDANQHDDSPG